MSKILVIDDERSIRRALKEIFEFESYDVHEAENGKAAPQGRDRGAPQPVRASVTGRFYPADKKRPLKGPLPYDAL